MGWGVWLLFWKPERRQGKTGPPVTGRDPAGLVSVSETEKREKTSQEWGPFRAASGKGMKVWVGNV